MGGGSSGIGRGSGANSSKINPNKQGRHIRGSSLYQNGKSYTMLSNDKLQDIIDSKLSIAQKISENKYRVSCGQVIGIYIDENGNEFPTTNAIIVTSKTGSHIYPAKPTKKGGKK